MKTKEQGLPRVVSREEWRVARESLLDKEKAAARARDALNAERRRLPMVKIEKNLRFTGMPFPADLIPLTALPISAREWARIISFHGNKRKGPHQPSHSMSSWFSRSLHQSYSSGLKELAEELFFGMERPLLPRLVFH